MILRPYKSCDAEKIVSWLGDEETFLRWGGSYIGAWPLSAETLDRKYREENGGFAEADNFYPWTACADDGRAVGHFIMRYLNGDRTLLRFGWVIVDPSLRGRGLGTEMLSLGLSYAFHQLGAERITLGVFENNLNAHACYRKLGFTDRGQVTGRPWNGMEMELTRQTYREL